MEYKFCLENRLTICYNVQFFSCAVFCRIPCYHYNLILSAAFQFRDVIGEHSLWHFSNYSVIENDLKETPTVKGYTKTGRGVFMQAVISQLVR